MSIGKKIAAGFALPLAILVGISVVSYLNTARLIEGAATRHQANKVLQTLEEIHTQLSDAQRGERGYVITGQERYLEPYHKAVKQIPQEVEALDRLARDNPKLHRQLSRLSTMIQEDLAELQKVIDLQKKGDAPAAVQEVKSGRGKDLMDRVAALTTEMKDDQRELLEKLIADVQASAQTAQVTIVVGTLGALVLGTVAAFFLVRSILAPVRQLLEGTRCVAQGMLGHRLNITSQDEMGELARAFDDMSAKRQESLESIRASINQLSSAGSEILASTTQQAAGAQEQAAAVAQTVATVDQVTQTADQSAQRAKGVADLVQRTLEVGKTGRKVMEDSLVAMDQVKEQVESTAANILALAEQAQAIGEIIATVTDIAEQTNLLALNAAIEASRAGEQRFPGLRARGDGGGAYSPRAGRSRRGRGRRQRLRHQARALATPLRTLLYHQAGGSGNGIGAVGQLRHHPRPRWHHHGRERAGAGQHLPHPPSVAAAAGGVALRDNRSLAA
jgi:methyl-accepting chemotaxis protein